MADIIITCDSTADLPLELIEKYNIGVIPLGVTLGDTTYQDGVNITPDEIYAHHAKTGELPKTTAANVGDFMDFFTPYVEAGKTVIHFPISSEMSSTYNNALLASAEWDNVHIIDSKNLSTGIGLVVVAAAEMAQSGMEAQAIVAKAEELVKCSDASFVIDNLEYLHKGGRCSAVAMLGANLLKLKPCIDVTNGKMDVSKKYRGKYGEVLKQYVSERLCDLSAIDDSRIFITHAGCADEIVNAVVEQVKAYGYFKEIIPCRAGCTISSHCGADTLGILYIRKSPKA
ncbi:MAG: DegV family protein [Ruminococcaceae bacterium]|nr:DegV family protein [Oscillospiraceae bacterium]